MHHLRSLRQLGLLWVFVLLAACASDATEPQISILSLVSGDGQSATVGEDVSDPLTVRVTQDGSGLAGRTVSWVITGGAGSVDPASSSTDNTGMASTTWTLGPVAGTNSVDATASGVTGSVTFTATGVALAPPPALAAVSVGDNFFDPDNQRVAVGGAVTWTWTGAIGHNVTFPTGAASATQSTGTFDLVFPDAGSFDYLCTIHGAAMSGTIVVE